MISNDQLLERIKSIEIFENDIKLEYEECIAKLTDQKVIQKIEGIRQSEITHIAIAQELVKIINE